MSNIKIASFTKEVTVLNIAIPNKNIAPALVGLYVGFLVYSILVKQ